MPKHPEHEGKPHSRSLTQIWNTIVKTNCVLDEKTLHKTTRQKLMFCCVPKRIKNFARAPENARMETALLALTHRSEEARYLLGAKQFKNICSSVPTGTYAKRNCRSQSHEIDAGVCMFCQVQKHSPERECTKGNCSARSGCHELAHRSGEPTR